MARNQLKPRGNYIDNETAKQIEDLKHEAQKIREDFLIIFGLLAAVIAFLTAEVQAFKELKSFASLVGFSSFIMATILSFVVGLQVIVRDDRSTTRYWPTFVLICLFLCVSGVAFYWGTHHYILFIH